REWGTAPSGVAAWLPGRGHSSFLQNGSMSAAAGHTLPRGNSMTYLGNGDPARRLTLFDGSEVERTDYRPVWVNNLADDVTIEGSAMNGVVQGAEAVRSIVTYIRTLYDDQEFSFAGPYGENGF